MNADIGQITAKINVMEALEKSATVAFYDTHEEAENAVKDLQKD